jgi:hypothetical protein
MKNEEYYKSADYAKMNDKEKGYIEGLYKDYNETYQLNRENERELSGGKL